MRSLLACQRCAIRNRSLCGSLTREELERLNGMAMPRSVAAGRVVAFDLDESISVANLVSGVVKLTKTLPDGRQQIVGLQFPGEFVGAPGTQASEFIAEAATKVQLCCFPRRSFNALLAESPRLKQSLLDQALADLDRAREWISLLGRKTAQERVASLLLLIAERLDAAHCAAPHGGGSVSYELPLSRAEIADHLGLTIETVSRQLAALRQHGIVVAGRGRAVHISDPDALRREAAAPTAL